VPTLCEALQHITTHYNTFCMVRKVYKPPCVSLQCMAGEKEITVQDYVNKTVPGGDAPAPEVQNRGAPGAQAVRAPQDYEQDYEDWNSKIIRLGYFDVMKVRKIMKEVYGKEITGEVTVEEAICAINAVYYCTERWTTGALDYKCLKILAPLCYDP